VRGMVFRMEADRPQIQIEPRGQGIVYHAPPFRLGWEPLEAWCPLWCQRRGIDGSAGDRPMSRIINS
jgi:hypothetical protein